jgi:hypothetical protein
MDGRAVQDRRELENEQAAMLKRVLTVSARAIARADPQIEEGVVMRGQALVAVGA